MRCSECNPNLQSVPCHSQPRSWRRHFRFLTISLAAFSCFGMTGSTNAQTPIYSLPFFILFPTKYRLEKSLTYEKKDGSAITILASNVDLDLNGCALESATGNQSIGILVDHQQKVTIRNGTIRGFKQSIVLDDRTKRIAWPGNDLSSNKITIQSVNASSSPPPPAGEKEPQPQTTTTQPKSSPSPSPGSEVSGSFLDRYDATKSSPQPSGSPHHRRRKNNQ